MLAASTIKGVLLRRSVITAATTFEFLPNTGLAHVRVQGAGGGGGGGGAGQAGGGGAAGAYAEKLLTIDRSQRLASVAIGAGGLGTSTNGNAGGASSLTYGSAAVVCPGGGGGSGPAAFAAGGVVTAIGTGGDINAGGRPGHIGLGSGATVGFGAPGGSSLFGAGGGSTLTNAGADAVGYGAGGGGSLAAGGKGGNGGAGVIVVDEYAGDGFSAVAVPQGLLEVLSPSHGDMFFRDANGIALLARPGARKGLSHPGGAANPAWVNIVQVAYDSEANEGTTTASIPVDDTIPLNTEGTEILSVSLTPQYSDSKIIVVSWLNYAVSLGSTVTMSLFKGSTCLTASLLSLGAGTNLGNIVAAHQETSGDTSARTYTARVGVTSGTLTYCGRDGGVGLWSTIPKAGILVLEVI